MLLIFDSCEHIIDELAPLAEHIVQEAPELHILATSRESFRTEGERVHRLFPLDCPPQRDGLGIAEILAYPASQLFVERIAESLGEFELSEEDAPLVAEICRRLDGIALAIELAAGRVNAYGIAGTASLLDSRFALLWRGRRTAIPRHQTLSAALAWSYDLLPAAESATLRGLSVFVGPFTMEAALAVASSQGISEPEAVEAISNLLSKSLIATSPAERRLRYRLLDTTRAFAGAKLVENGEAPRVARAHAEYFRDFLRDIALKSTGMQTAGGFLPYADHLPNVRAALAWSFSDNADRTIGVDLAASAAQFFLELTLLTECYRWTKQALVSLDTNSIDRRQEMTLQAALGVSVMFTQGNTEAVRSAFTRSLQLARDLEDLHWQLWLLRGLHIYLTRVGDFHGALGTGEQGESVARKLNDPAAALNVEWMLGVAHHLIGNQDKAVQFCESAMVHNPGSQRLNIGHLGYDDRIVALVALARGLWLTGRPDRDRGGEIHRSRGGTARTTPHPRHLPDLDDLRVPLGRRLGQCRNPDRAADRPFGAALPWSLSRRRHRPEGRAHASPWRHRRRDRASSPQPGHAVRDAAPDHDDGVCDGAGGGPRRGEPAGRGLAHDQ
ncbi:putative ATPase [Bradyrhizobium sp. i1.4.4]